LFFIKRRIEKVALQHHNHRKPKEFGSYYTGIKSRPKERTPAEPTTLFSNWGNSSRRCVRPA